MGIKKLAREAWANYFDAFSREDGAQPETSWLPLAGITYDRKDDLLEVLVENRVHRCVERPRRRQPYTRLEGVAYSAFRRLLLRDDHVVW